MRKQVDRHDGVGDLARRLVVAPEWPKVEDYKLLHDHLRALKRPPGEHNQLDDAWNEYKCRARELDRFGPANS